MEQEQENIKNKPNHSKKSFLAVFIILSILISSFFGTVFGFMGGRIADSIFSKMGLASKSPRVFGEKIVEDDSAVIDVVQNSSPAVVSIVITKDVPRYKSFFEDPFGFFNERNQEGTEKHTVGSGSGFFIDSSGMIVTNKHVVGDQGADYTAITNEGKEYPAKVLARDPVKDIAIIKVEGNDFPTLEFNNSNELKIGQTVIAIGNSLGEFYNTVSKGIISGLQRNVTAGSGTGRTEHLTNIIQTDAAINPGNSGGPLLDVDGKVIGINVAMAQGAQNIGFAIPSNQIIKIIEQVKNSGKISTPFLGVRSIALNEKIQKENNLPYTYGALVARGEKVTDFAVMPGSPADKAGIQENDIILEINGKKIDNKNQISDAISDLNVGQEISMKIWHKGETKEIRVTLGERQ
jgi:serine protease Do